MFVLNYIIYFSMGGISVHDSKSDQNILLIIILGAIVSDLAHSMVLLIYFSK